MAKKEQEKIKKTHNNKPQNKPPISELLMFIEAIMLFVVIKQILCNFDYEALKSQNEAIDTEKWW